MPKSGGESESEGSEERAATRGEPDARALLEALRAGDASAYREVLRRHGDKVYGFLLRLSGRRDLADDLFQETWLALAEHAARLRDDTRIEAWLFTVARNAYRSHRRWAWVDMSRWFVDDDERVRGVDAASAAPSPEEDFAARSTARDVDRALSTLRPEEREVILLSAIDGLDHSEAAAILKLGPEAHRQRLSRARKALAENLHGLQNSGRRR